MNTSSTPNVQMAYTDGTANRVRPTSLTYPNGRQVVFQYGPSAEIDAKASRIRNLRDSGVDLVQYDYLGENSVVQQTSPQADLEQTLISLTGSDDPDTGDIYAGLDRFGRIKDLRWRNTSSSTDLARREYGYDRDSNRLWSADPVDTNSAHDWLLSYDGLQRLKDAERGELNGTHSAISTLDFAQCWTLDATNNWQNFRQNDDGSGGWDLEQERTANTVNEITDITNSTGPTAITPTYDANGNMVTDRSGNHLLYDAWNRLMRVGDPSNALLQRNDYDARGFLVRKRNYSGGVVSERFENYYTDSWQLIEVRPGTSTTVSEQNVWGLRYIDDLVLRDRDKQASTPTDQGGESASAVALNNGTLDERLYCAQDANWNAIAVIDTSGAVQERYSYTPYGQVTFLSPSYATRSSSDYAWTTLATGRAWDPVSGFYHFRRREYDAILGVFLTRDPLGYVDGSGLYVPYFVPNGVDPFGLDDWVWPWDPRASWDPCDTANLILTGDVNADQETLNAASAGWLNGFGRVPGLGSFGNFAYTGQFDPTYETLCDAVSDPCVHKAFDCVAECIKDVHENGIPIAAGTFGGYAAGGWAARDVLPFPKGMARTIWGSRARMTGASSFTSLARLKSVYPRLFGLSPESRACYRELANLIKRGPIDPRTGLRPNLGHSGPASQMREICRRGARSFAKGAISAVAITEVAIATYCERKCAGK